MNNAFLPIREWRALSSEPAIAEEFLKRSKSGLVEFEGKYFTGTMLKSLGERFDPISYTEGSPDSREPFSFLFNKLPVNKPVVPFSITDEDVYTDIDPNIPVRIRSEPYSGTVVSLYDGRLYSISLVEGSESYEHGSLDKNGLIEWYTLATHTGSYSQLIRAGEDSQYSLARKKASKQVHTDSLGALKVLVIDNCFLSDSQRKSETVGCFPQLNAYEQLEGIEISSWLLLRGQGINNRVKSILLDSPSIRDVATIFFSNCVSLTPAAMVELIRETGARTVEIDRSVLPQQREALDGYAALPSAKISVVKNY